MNIEEAKKEIQELVDMLGSRRDREDLAIIYNFMKKTQAELEKKDKMIEFMGKLLYEHRNFFGWYEVGIDIENVKQQIEYFEREVGK